MLTYHTFIVRCWQEDDLADNASWRFVLENPAHNQKQGFVRKESLVNAMRDELEHLTSERATEMEEDSMK